MAETAKIVEFHEFGPPDVLKLESVPLPEPKAGEVRLKMRALGINRADVLFRQGLYVWTPPLPSRIGVEGSGVVDAVGPGGNTDLIGRSVLCVPNFSPNDYGVYGEVAIVPENAVAPYPESIGHEVAAASLVQYLTTWGALVHFAKVGPGDFVLLTAASSSTGVAAIQLVKACGGTSIATTRSPAKAQALREQGADHVIVDGEEDLVERVMEITGSAGARVIYDPIAGESLTDMVRATAKGGLIIEYGVLSDQPTVIPMMDAFPRHLMIKIYDMHELLEDSAVVNAGLDYVFGHLEAGSLQPVIARSFPLEQIADAHAFMESCEQIGKIIVTVP